MSDARLDVTIEAIASVYFLLNALFYQHLVSFVQSFSRKPLVKPETIKFMRIAGGVLAAILALKAVVDYSRLA